MPAFFQRLGYVLAATAALLTGSTGIDFYHRSTSFVCFVLQDALELAPASIGDRPTQQAVLDHVGHGQAFRSDESKATNESVCDLVVMLTPLVLDAGMNPPDRPDNLLSVLPTLLLPRNGPLSHAERGQFSLEVAWVRLMLAVRIGEKVLKTHVDASFGKPINWSLCRFDLTREDGVPLVRFALKRNRFDPSTDGTVQFDFDCSDVLDAELVIDQFDAVTVSGELNRIETILGFETGITRRLATLDSFKEPLKRFIKTPERSLTGRGIGLLEPFVRSAKIRKLSGLVAVVDRHSMLAPHKIPLLQSGVVESAMCLQHDPKFVFLVGVRVETVLERSSGSRYNRVSHDALLFHKGRPGQEPTTVNAVIDFYYYWVQLIGSQGERGELHLSPKGDSPRSSFL